MRRRSVRVRSLIVCAWLALLTCGCSKVSETSQLGTNTNWLKTCSKASECGAKGSCVCGVCTSACTGDGQCGSVHEETSCQLVSGTACESAQAAPASACLQACRADDDCSALERGRCVDGLCVPVARLGAEPEASEPSAPTPGAPSGSGQPGFELERVDDKVEITSAYTECERDLECTLVGTSCDGCCQVGAINVGYKYIYDPERERACFGYRGAQCRCQFPDLVPRCEAGRCRTAPRDTAACFSPTQNQQRAFDEGALGCRCQRRDDAICAGGAAMRCAQEGSDITFRESRVSLSAWQLSETRPCEPKPDSDCSADGRFTSAELCLRAFSSCFELTSGDFCGLLSR